MRQWRPSLMVIELDDPTDPRFLLVRSLPDRVSVADLVAWRYGKPLSVCPAAPVTIYQQPDGPGSDWIRP